jgi:membrane dipeptidase
VVFTLQQIDLLRRLATQYPKVFSPPDVDSERAIATFREGKIISPLAIEGLHSIGTSISLLRLYRALGVKYATLTHNCHNPFADAALVTNETGSTIKSSPYWGGLSDRGKLGVQEMNRLGMLVDLSHASKDTMIDVLGGRPGKFNGSVAPTVFSHSSAYALCPHPRNVPDDVLELVKRTNSVVMVTFVPDFISCVPSNQTSGLPELYKPNVTLHQVARHIVYIGDKIGYDHVGIGSDFDGIEETPEGLEDVSKFPDLVAELFRLGVSDDDAAKIVGKNVLRVWKDADEVAVKLQKDGLLPVEDDTLDSN